MKSDPTTGARRLLLIAVAAGTVTRSGKAAIVRGRRRYAPETVRTLVAAGLAEWRGAQLRATPDGSATAARFARAA